MLTIEAPRVIRGSVMVSSVRSWLDAPGRSSLLLVAALSVVLVASWRAPVAAAADWPNSLPLTASYDVSADLDWDKRRLTVTSTAQVSNSAAKPYNELTFNLVPPQLASFQITETSVDGEAASFVRNGQNLSIQLPQPLPVGQQATVRIGYRAWFTSSLGGSDWMFTKSSKTATAYRWIPWLSQRSDFTDIGDPFTTSIADEVDVAITTDRPLTVAATGRLVSKVGLTQRFHARNVPDFNFTASPDYKLRTLNVGGVAVRIYTRTLAADKLAQWADRALRRFSNLIGPYPYSTLSIAETPGGAAIESPAHIWIPAQSSGSAIPYRVVHEIAHQWFYAGVGNNQVWQPFADEAVAEFLSRDLLGHRQRRCDQARLDGSVYDYGTTCYYDVIYTQGDRYLMNYRESVGDAAFWAGLRDYYASYRFRMGGTRDLLDALDAASGWTAGHAGRFPSLY